MKVFLVLAMALATAALPGCMVRGRSEGTVAVGKPACSHSDTCGHYRHKGTWHYSEGHRHGPNCGHHYDAGVWIVLD
jgi:hypothetical protein